MNIRIFLSAVVQLLWSQYACAQFPSFPDSNAVWVMTVNDGPTMVDEYAFHLKENNHDSLINGLIYNTLWYGFTDESTAFIGGIREEPDGKVYYYHPNSDSTYLLYDFDPLIGDSMEVWIGPWYAIEPFTIMMYVVSIDTIFNNNGTTYKSIGIMNEFAQGETDSWIQGVGGTGGLLETFGSGTISLSIGLTCMSHNDTLWPAGSPGNCASTMSVSEQVSSGLAIWPNPSSGIFTVRWPSDLAEVQEVFLFDALGNQVPISVTKDLDTLDVAIASSCEAGLYFLRSIHTDGSSHSSRLILQP